jgi:hypothetical protein
MIAQHQQTKAQISMYNAQAQAAEANKRISDRKQEQIAMQQLQERDKMDNRMKLVAGTNAAEAGAGGLQMAGSPLQLMASSYDEYNKDIYNWEQNKNNAIYNEYLNGMNYQNEANAARASAKNARRQGNLAMVGSILGAASSMYGIKQQYAGGKMTTTYGGDPVGYTDKGPVVTVKRDYKMR